jgi:DNA polymerase
MTDEQWQQILDEARHLVTQAAHPRRRTVPLAPETAALLERLDSAAPVPGPPGPDPEAAAHPGEDRETALAALAAEVSACTRCGLHATRRQTVFGDGPADARLVFVGEAPGAEEDRQGLPFVGPAGQLLTSIIEKGMGLSRNEVFICNVLKCRPPNNRDPASTEKQACEPYLQRQLALLKPEVICCLGGHAAKTLLRTEASTGRLRGTWHFYEGIPLRVTYHPSYLLRLAGTDREKAEKRKVWDDVKAVMRVLNGEEQPAPPAGEPGLV